MCLSRPFAEPHRLYIEDTNRARNRRAVDI